MKVTRTAISRSIEQLIERKARKVTVYLDNRTVVTATFRCRPRARDTRTEIALKLGGPNYQERQHIKRLLAKGETVRNAVTVQHYPAPAPVKKKKK